MQIQIIPEVGDRFKIKIRDWGFCFMNKHGGTGMSNSEYEEKYTGPQPIVEITKVWYDYEVGYRCWAKAITPELIEYLDKVANSNDKRVFVSEHELEVLNVRSYDS